MNDYSNYSGSALSLVSINIILKKCFLEVDSRSFSFFPFFLQFITPSLFCRQIYKKYMLIHVTFQIVTIFLINKNIYHFKIYFLEIVSWIRQRFFYSIFLLSSRFICALEHFQWDFRFCACPGNLAFSAQIVNTLEDIISSFKRRGYDVCFILFRLLEVLLVTIKMLISRGSL